MTLFATEQCIHCFMEFHVPKAFQDRRFEDKKNFFCPQCGKTMAYMGEREEDKLRRELNRAKQNAAYLEESIKHQRERAESAERSAAAQRGQVTKLRNRVGRGVCPCCNRTFIDLQRHRHSQHPDFHAQAAE